MNIQAKRRFLTLPVMTALAAATLNLTATAQAAPNLVINGKVASSNVKTVGGRPYVSLSDLAKSMGMVVVKTKKGYEIKKAGGTYQAGDLNGKIGDVLFDGKWRFQVLSVASPESFQMRTDASPYDHYDASTYDQKTRIFRPKAGYKLVIISVRVTNGQKTTQTLWTAISDKAMRTALTDTSGSSHAPLDYDYEGGPNVTKPILPGAGMTFPIIFSVPTDATLKDLVFTLKNNESFTKGSDARVSLR